MAWTDYSSAPPAGTPVCASAEVTGTLTLEVSSEAGRFPMILVQSPEGLRGYVNACPHQYLPLDYRVAQLLSADGTMLLCTAHGARFDAASGAVIGGADCGLDMVPLCERNGQILIGG
jgi:nitrite reductase/ring-hydroxylating ferredoxin subunit